MEKKYVYDLHAEHREWLNKIAFYKDEIKIMRHRLEQVTEKNTSKEVLALVEHFQNQLIVQEEQNDILRLSLIHIIVEIVISDISSRIRITKSNSKHRIVGDGNGPYIGIAFTHSAITEA